MGPVLLRPRVGRESEPAAATGWVCVRFVMILEQTVLQAEPIHHSPPGHSSSAIITPGRSRTGKRSSERSGKGQGLGMARQEGGRQGQV